MLAWVLHNWPSQANPTEEPVSQVVNNVHKAILSSLRLPRHSEKRFNRDSIVAEPPQGTFHFVRAGG